MICMAIKVDSIYFKCFNLWKIFAQKGWCRRFPPFLYQSQLRMYIMQKHAFNNNKRIQLVHLYSL